jgi:tRNA-specific adenosine deaminase 1
VFGCGVRAISDDNSSVRQLTGSSTGMKCLPRTKVAQAQGITIHDWHAEILAIRSFNRFLLDECHSLASSQNDASDFIHLRSPEERTEAHFQPFALNDDIILHMYCSEAPCTFSRLFEFVKGVLTILSGGDASMEITMASQSDSTPWDLPSAANHLGLSTNQSTNSSITTSTSSSRSSPLSPMPETQLQGRGYFSALGIVRRKPSRPDAPPTLSKSCSDKLGLKQCTSLLSSITSLLISPSGAYLSSLILPESQYSASGCSRAFSASGRMKELTGMDWENGYSFRPFEVRTTGREFSFSRRQTLIAGDKLVPSNISVSWTPHQFETLVGGVLRGRKQGDIKGASRVCKSRMWKLALEVSELVAMSQVERCLKLDKYVDIKRDRLLDERRRVKDDVRHEALDGWVRNLGGDVFSLEDSEI